MPTSAKNQKKLRFEGKNLSFYQEMLYFFQDPNEEFPSRKASIIQERTSCSSKHKKILFFSHLAIVAFLDPCLIWISKCGTSHPHENH
jgi:hypothetical protein